MRKKWSKLHLTLRIGIILLIVGISPLLIILGLSELGVIYAGNALGLGILAMLTFYPSIILIIIGSVLTFIRSRKAKVSL
jgi:hypothetical protein